MSPRRAADRGGVSISALARRAAAVVLEEMPPGTIAVKGDPGQDGAAGRSAYQLAQSQGFVGTLTDWLGSLVGPPGRNGRDGQDGAPGQDGRPGRDGSDGAVGASAYQLARAHGYGGSEVQWLASLLGTDGNDGDDGRDGLDGASAYQVARAHGYGGTETQWLATLIGPAGAPGRDGTNGTAGRDGVAGRDGAAGRDGIDGKSATPSSYGLAALPALALAANVDVTVALTAPMPDASYTVAWSSTVPLTSYTLTVKSRTTTAVVVNLKALLGVGAGTLLAHARYP